jgi:hypothetical protein
MQWFLKTIKEKKGSDMLKIIVIVCSFLLPVQALSATCSDIASQFAKDPNAISAEDLATLKRCVDSKLREKMGTSGVPKPPTAAPPQAGSLPKIPSPPAKPAQPQ